MHQNQYFPFPSPHQQNQTQKLVSLVFITVASITFSTFPFKSHLKFPSSTCDPSLNHPYMDPTNKRLKLWSSKPWLSQVSSFTTFFRSLNLLNNETKVLCVSAGAEHEEMALNNMGVSDVTGVEIVDSLPLVKRAGPNNLPFFYEVFDLAFSSHLEDALFPLMFLSRTLTVTVCVVVVEECG